MAKERALWLAKASDSSRALGWEAAQAACSAMPKEAHLALRREEVWAKARVKWALESQVLSDSSYEEPKASQSWAKR